MKQLKKILLNKYFFIFFVFSLSFFLRFYNLPKYISFHQDQVRDLLFIKDHFDKKLPILLGPKASVGDFYLPPFWYYLMSSSYLFSPSPLSPAIMVIFLNSLAVIFIYLFCEQFFNKKTAVFSSLLYAVSPISIEYSRFAWNPNPIPFFVIISIYCLFLYLFKQKKNFIYLSVIAANLTFQLHYQGFLLVTVVFIFIIFKKDWKRLFFSVVFFTLMLSPFLIFELKNNFPNLKEIISFITRINKGRSFGITNSLKSLFNEYPIFISRTLFSGFFPLGLIFSFITYLILIKNTIEIINNNFFKSKIKVFYFIFLILLITLFIYRQWIIPYYLLVILIPLIIFFTIFFQKFTLIFLLLIIINFLYSPAFKKTDSSYLFFKESALIIEKSGVSSNCIKVINKNPDLNFTYSAVYYLMTLDKYEPKHKDQCKNKFIFCEKNLCDKIKGVKKLSSQILELELIKQ